MLIKRSQIQYCPPHPPPSGNRSPPPRNEAVILLGFSFPNEFIADYPTCLYGMKSELNIQAIIPCEIYICSSTFLQQKFKENNENQRIAVSPAEQMFFQSYSRYLDLFRFTPEERYLQLLKNALQILQMVSLKEIASYLKITPYT